MKRFLKKSRTFLLAFTLIAALLSADYFARSAVKTAMASARHVPITCVKTDKTEVALTYNVTEKSDIYSILCALGDTEITFFVSCEFLASRFDDVKNIINGGHEIGLIFDDLKGRTKQEIYDELAAAIEEAAFSVQHSCKLIRFFRNSYDGNSVKAVFSVDLYPVQWSTDSTMQYFSSGDIILITDDTDIGAFAKKISADGFKAVTVSDMLIKGNYTIDISGEMSAK